MKSNFTNLKQLTLVVALTLGATCAQAENSAPTTNPTSPTNLSANVIAVYSDTYSKGLVDNNPSWGTGGGAPNPIYTSVEETEIADGHKVVHVKGTGFNNRTAGGVGITSDYNTIHVALYPFSATTAKIFGDNDYGNAISVDGLVPGQWNYVEIENNNVITQNYVVVELVDETEFYLDHFYFAKPAVDDDEAPSFDKAELVSAGIGSITLSLKATDNKSANITYIITDQDNQTYTTHGTSGTETTYTVGNLTYNKAYTLTIVAQDDNENISTSKSVTATTLGLSAAPTPTHDAEDVVSVYSDTYTTATTWSAGGWGQSTVQSTEQIDGNNTLKFSTFNYFGFDNFGTQLSISEMEYVHLDILPISDITLRFTPIMRGGTTTENAISVGNLVTGQWNSIDIALADFGLDTENYKVFQLKFDNGNGTQTFYADNIYFWKGEAAPVEVSSLTLSATETNINEGQTTQLTVKNQYNSIVATSALTFTSDNNSVVTVDEEGVVSAIAEGNATIVVTYNEDPTIEATIEITVSKVSTSGSSSYIIASGDNAGKELKYTWAFAQTGTDVTVTFACTNADEIVGIVDGYIHDKTNGFAEISGLNYTWTDLAEGDVVTVSHKWLFAGGDFVTPDVSYTVKVSGDYPAGTPTAISNTIANVPTSVKVYSLSGQYIGTFESISKVVVATKGIYIVNGKKILFK